MQRYHEPAEAITMTAAERKPDEKHLYREEKYASIYEINMLRCIFAGYVKMHVQKTLYLTTQNTCSLVMREKILYMEG
jgi:NADH-quinone oxidoreductase subunit I